ncbi:MAG: plasmid replication initiator TrfA [Polyangiaceae bacterium]|jgi:TrfA protein
MSDEARRPKTCTRYTEAETLAILEVERLGKPLPHPVPKLTAKADPPVGTPEWLEAATAKREAATVFQLGFWPDDKRAMPGEFIACALFSSIQEKDSEYLEGSQLASINGLSVTYTGHRLTQVHADVWEAIMHLGRQFPEGSCVQFRSRQLLSLMGRHTGKSQRDQLKTWLRHLSATCVEITDTKEKRHYWGSLLPRGADKVEGDDTLYAVEINRDLAKMFQSGIALVDWNQRQELRGKWLALWLQRHFARFQKPMAVADLYRLSDSKTKRLVDFRKQLRAALADLQAVGVIAAWRVDAATDTLHITANRRAPGGLPTPSGGASDSLPASPAPDQPSLHLPLPPAVNAETRARFRALYPGKDVDRCLADFTAWLSNSGKSADKPNAAFLGFAKKWGS